jgi:hypothetical protein
MARNFLRIELALNDDLRCDAGVICAGYPQGIFATHTSVTYQAIHDGLVKGVAHVKGACHVRWRQLNREIFFTFIKGSVGNASKFPFRTPIRFNWGGFVGFGQFVCGTG